MELKPLDEKWMPRMLWFVHAYRKSTGTGPTWTEITNYLGWRRSCSTYFRIRKMRKRGLEWVDEEPRSTHVTEEGRAVLEMLKR